MLTQKKINTLKPKPHKYFIAHSDNLLLCIYPSGKKSFFYNYKCPKTHKYKRKKLGSHPQTTLGKAKRLKDEFKSLLNAHFPSYNENLNPLIYAFYKNLPPQNTNTPPINEPKFHFFKKQKISFKKLALIKMHEKSLEITPKSYQSLMSVLKRFAFEFYALKPIDEVSIKDILKGFEKLKAAKIKESANRLFTLLNEIFRFALMKGFIIQNPMYALSRKDLIIKKPTKHFATLTGKTEIKKLLQAVLNFNCEKKTKIAIFMLALSAQRSINIRQSTWKELDLNKNLWTIPPEKMKMRKKHILPISPQLAFLLKNYRLICKDENLFHSTRSKRGIMSENTMRIVFKRLGYRGDEFVPHGFRSMFSTLCHENTTKHKISTDIIEQCLAHSERNKIKASYNHALNLKEKAKLMNWWADYLDHLLDLKTCFLKILHSA